MSQQPYLIEFQHFTSPEKGAITIAENGVQLPFDVKRTYWVYDNPVDSVRGNHAHVYSEQVLVAMHGSVRVVLENLEGEVKEYILNGPQEGLYVPPMYWRIIYLDQESVCLSFSSHRFAEDDYIRDKDQFKKK